MITETTFTASARTDENGEAQVKVTAHVGYGKRTAATTIELADEKLAGQIAGLLKKAIAASRGELMQQATVNAARCVVAAADQKEAV